MMRLLSAPMARASAAWVRIDGVRIDGVPVDGVRVDGVRSGCSASAFSTTYPHIETWCARSTGSSAATRARPSGTTIAARSRRDAASSAGPGPGVPLMVLGG